MKKHISTIFAYLCFALLLVCLAADAAVEISSASLCTEVLRLHILADSDSEEDQRLKLLVRDGLLPVTKDLFGDCKNASQALERAEESRALLEAAAQRVLLENGCSKRVTIVTGIEKYPERTYGTLTLDEGEYLSTRVLIGSGKGKNWWCVLFPPLCNAGAESTEAASVCVVDGDMTEKLQNEIDGGIEIFGCRIKLKILEIFN